MNGNLTAHICYHGTGWKIINRTSMMFDYNSFVWDLEKSSKNPYLDALCEEGSTPICFVDKTGDTWSSVRFPASTIGRFNCRCFSCSHSYGHELLTHWSCSQKSWNISGWKILFIQWIAWIQRENFLLIPILWLETKWKHGYCCWLEISWNQGVPCEQHHCLTLEFNSQEK